ncbi:MAG: glutamate--cysteine ligase [Gammaproteobacteria bacterium]|nr:MAG: glutamate--cysteine ligase [Gammaproteobacteria bacterium]
MHCPLDALAGEGLLPWLARIQRGIEKESLRIHHDGALAQTPHPASLGSALTHPCITTDFSEALLEFITAPHETPEATLAELTDIHRYTHQHIGDEILWSNSMPCPLGTDGDIPVARYGSSNIGTMKTVYRQGLANRYGKRMQTIAGIHYNFSLPEAFWPWYARHCAPTMGWQDLRDSRYLGLIRNFRRYSWLLLYLFGASPAICRTFLGKRPHKLQTMDGLALYAPWGTSLRMGDLGYQSNAQEALYVNYNDLRSYIHSLRTALATPHPEFTRLGIKVNGEYRQLRDTILQIENEFYSSIRPKRVAGREQTPSAALEQSGIEYVEVRCMDINPFLPLGIDADTARFLDLFLLGCLFWESPPSSREEALCMRENTRRTVYEGRHPLTRLLTLDGERGLREWGQELLDGLQSIAALMDMACGGHAYRNSLQQQLAKLADERLTPSAQVLSQLRTRRCSYFDFAMELSEQHARNFRQQALPEATLQQFRQWAASSIAEQQQIERTDNESFDDFLARYFSH